MCFLSHHRQHSVLPLSAYCHSSLLAAPRIRLSLHCLLWGLSHCGRCSGIICFYEQRSVTQTKPDSKSCFPRTLHGSVVSFQCSHHCFVIFKLILASSCYYLSSVQLAGSQHCQGSSSGMGRESLEQVHLPWPPPPMSAFHLKKVLVHCR